MNAKAKVLEAVAGKNRGLLATESDRVKVLATIEQLEDHNPYPKPLRSKRITGAGNWRLLYTTSRAILGLDRFPSAAIRTNLSIYTGHGFSAL